MERAPQACARLVLLAVAADPELAARLVPDILYEHHAHRALDLPGGRTVILESSTAIHCDFLYDAERGEANEYSSPV